MNDTLAPLEDSTVPVSQNGRDANLSSAPKNSLTRGMCLHGDLSNHQINN